MILNKYVSLPGDITISFVFVYNIVMAFTISTAILYSSSISFIFCQSIELKILQKSVKSRTAGRCFAFALSVIRLVLRIFPEVGLF